MSEPSENADFTDATYAALMDRAGRMTSDCLCEPGYELESDAADVIRDLRGEVDDLQRLPQPLRGFVPQTYGDAIMRGWIKHGDCAPHEWDNRTSAANARWMLERFLTARRGGGEHGA